MQARWAFSQLRGVALGHCFWQNTPSSVSIWWGAKPRSSGFTQPFPYSFICELNISLCSISRLCTKTLVDAGVPWLVLGSLLGLRRRQRSHTLKCDRTWKQMPTQARISVKPLAFLWSQLQSHVSFIFTALRNPTGPRQRLKSAESQHPYWWTAVFTSCFELSQRGGVNWIAPKPSSLTPLAPTVSQSKPFLL